MDLISAKKFLSDAGLFFYPIGGCEDDEDEQVLNMNDIFGWALAFGQKVEDNEVNTVVNLFLTYGFCGVVYWVSEKNEQMMSEFSHINRMIQFVRNEERISKEYESLTKYAYGKRKYTISA